MNILIAFEGVVPICSVASKKRSFSAGRTLATTGVILSDIVTMFRLWYDLVYFCYTHGVTKASYVRKALRGNVVPVQELEASAHNGLFGSGAVLRLDLEHVDGLVTIGEEAVAILDVDVGGPQGLEQLGQ